MRYRFEPHLTILVCAGIIAGYFWISAPAKAQYGLLEPSQQHFNQLVAGFRSGHLSLEKAPDPELAKLADPYDPAQNANYRLHDASYYKGKFYIYYGITPVVVLFWPYFDITGHYLAQKYAVAIFCTVGFLAGAVLAWQSRRRCFPKVGTGVFLSMVLAVGTVNGAAFLLRRPEMYEVSISCAYAMIMAALVALWCSLTSGRHPLAWTALSSVFFGMAVGARPTFLFGAAALVIPLVCSMTSSPALHAGRTGRWKLTLAAFGPIALIGIGLAVYNYLRFESPFEFGIRFLMMGKRVTSFFGFNWRYIWLNARLYFFLPTKLMGYFPFVRGVDIPPLPLGYGFAENPYGVLPNIPFLLLASATPLALRQSQSAMALRLKLFASALGWLCITSVAVLLIYVVATIRYEVDFTPYLTMLAVLGVFGVEDYCSTHPKWRNLARFGWASLLVVSCAFNFLGSCQHLDILRKDAPNEFQALSRFFDRPIYYYHRYLAPEPAAPPLIQSVKDDVDTGSYGAVLEKIEFPADNGGTKEPLLVIRSTPQTTFIVSIRSISKNHIAVGFEFSGIGSIECNPIEIEQNTPIDVAIFAPQLFPDLGYPDWNGTSYSRQLSRLGLYTIFVNHVDVLQISSPLNGTVVRDLPFLVGANPLKDTSVSSRFTGRILEVSRLRIGEQ
jgi:hypothetical protein